MIGGAANTLDIPCPQTPVHRATLWNHSVHRLDEKSLQITASVLHNNQQTSSWSITVFLLISLLTRRMKLLHVHYTSITLLQAQLPVFTKCSYPRRTSALLNPPGVIIASHRGNFGTIECYNFTSRYKDIRP